jgi:hypothetical protein
MAGLAEKRMASAARYFECTANFLGATIVETTIWIAIRKEHLSF